ncbi:MAG: ATP--cob(I)alamin adenosyltransferase [Spirochaetaceae bacterium]|jgi:cob(I)alamin adenosyltransferase|nr:ATP--cob(I)alamin adenosyltransferase [Spirochaetaceae bacterium]
MNSTYLAYSFLYDDAADLRCDFELLTDEIASMTGLLRSLLSRQDAAALPEARSDLERVNRLVYHLNPSLRAGVGVTPEELAWLHRKTMSLQEAAQDHIPRTLEGEPTFLIPQGCTPAALSHVLRCKCKTLARLVSRHQQGGHEVDELVFDFANLLSGYFYSLALALNKSRGEKEQLFISRAY